MSKTEVELFVERQSTERLAHVVFQVHRVLDGPGADEIHDLRVAIRRLNHALRAFLPVLPEKAVRKVRRRLKRVMNLTSETRNRDIALEFLDRAKVAPRSRIRARVDQERADWQEKLIADLRKLSARDFGGRWRRRLGLAAAPEEAAG